MISLFKYEPETDCLMAARFWVSGKSIMHCMGKLGGRLVPPATEYLRLPNGDSAREVLTDNVVREYLESGWWEDIDLATEEMEIWRTEVPLDENGIHEFDPQASIKFCPLCGGPLHHHKDIGSDNPLSVSAEASCFRCGTRFLSMSISWAPPRVIHIDLDEEGVVQEEWEME